MPDYMWIIISAIGASVIGVTARALVQRGGKIGIGPGFIVVDGKAQAPGPWTPVVNYIAKKTPEIQHILFGRYLRLIKDVGADPNRLAEYDDSRFVRMMLRYACNGGNCSGSIQKIVEAEIADGAFSKWEDLDRYVCDEVWPQILMRLKNEINSEYDARVLGTTGAMYDRWVSGVEFVEGIMEESVKRDICKVVIQCMLFAKSCRQGGCKD